MGGSATGSSEPPYSFSYQGGDLFLEQSAPDQPGLLAPTLILADSRLLEHFIEACRF